MAIEEILYVNNEARLENYKLLSIFNALLIASLFLCDSFIFKIVLIFNHPIALSGIIFPATSLIMICINEVYGHQNASKSIISLVIAQMIFLLGLVIIPRLPSPPNYDPSIIKAYSIAYKSIWRVFLSSPFGIVITFYMSSIINSKLKLYFLGKFIFVRFLLNSMATTAILVSIIYPINFFNILSWSDILDICLSTYVYKIIMSLLVLFIAIPTIGFCKKIEKKYIFDVDTSFNPMSIYSNKNVGVNLYEEIF